MSPAGGIPSGWSRAVGLRSKPSDVVAEVTSRVKGALAVRSSKIWSTTVEVPHRPPSYEAYLEFLQGVAAFGPGTYPEAERHFRRALRLDPGYVDAAAVVRQRVGSATRADSPRPTRSSGSCEEPTAYSQATPAEQAAVRYGRAELDGNLRGALAAASDWARLVPFSGELLHAGSQRNETSTTLARPSSRCHGFVSRTCPATVGPGASWFLDTRASVHHELGEYDKELEVARLGQQHYPGVAAFFAAEIRASRGFRTRRRGRRDRRARRTGRGELE